MDVQDCMVTFSIADILFTLKTPHPLTITEAFRPFLAEQETLPGEPGDTSGTERIITEFCEQRDIAFPSGEPVFRDVSFAVYETHDGESAAYFRVYHDHREDDRPYAVSGKQRCDGMESERRKTTRQRIRYLPDSRIFFGESGNTFSHISFELLLIQKEAMILHASFIETAYGGLLFSGPSGVGKSTQAELWRKARGAQIINGDRTIIRRKHGKWRAYGSPYAGSSRCFVNQSAALRAVIVLEQAEVCRISRLNPAQAFVKLYSQMIVNTWDSGYVGKLSRLIGGLLQEVPVYQYACTPEEESVNCLDTFLREETANES